jgi:5-methyltetrahydrofolate--homocysteine methyltransferase
VIDLGVMVPCDKLLKMAKEQNVDMIGLSGLITPSLDEMVHVAKEMEREGFKIPLLIGGATTSRVHTAVKIAPAYSQPVVHVLDASRAVGVVGSLRSSEMKPAYVESNRREQEKAREEHKGKRAQRPLLRLEEARRRRFSPEWKSFAIYQPSFTGIKRFDNFPLEEIVPYIDWTPFFHTWELRGVFPRILEDKEVGPKAKELHEDALQLLRDIVERRLLTARAVIGFFPANSVGDDIEVYSDNSRTGVLTILHTLRQQTDRPEGQANLALADFIAPRESGLPDFVGGFAVTAGINLDPLVEKFEKDHDDYNSIMAKALADRLAEAFAELTHLNARREWGLQEDENAVLDDLIHERYQGIRPAPGYPACPDHTEKRLLFDLLQVEKNTGILLTENFAMLPAASVSGFYFSHPESRYFAVGKIDRDQVLEYSRRKGMDVKTVERWLAPNLNYDPADL